MAMQGQVGVVTGGAQGLGKGFAEALLKRGAKICIADVQVERGEETVAYFERTYGVGRAVFIQCDVSVPGDVKAMLERVRGRYGRLDLLVNNAGISNEEQFSLTVDINLKGVIMGTQYGIEMMRKDKGGNGGIIINIGSTAGLVPVFSTPVYAATKYGVVGFTRSWAENPYMKSLGVKFACLCPAFTDTEIMRKEKNQLVNDDERQKREEMLKNVGIMEVSQVVAAFEQLLDMSDNNGAVMAVSKKTGVKIRHRSSRL